jgi:hypothetical protein
MAMEKCHYASLSSNVNLHKVKFRVDGHSPNQDVCIETSRRPEPGADIIINRFRLSPAQITLIREFINLRAKYVEAQFWMKWHDDDEDHDEYDGCVLIKCSQMWFEVTSLGLPVQQVDKAAF